MKLEHQVCSLDLAKRLKELGVKQESLFKWHDEMDDSNPYVCQTEHKVWENQCSAFTVAELGEMLPKIHGNGQNYVAWTHRWTNWLCEYISLENDSLFCDGKPVVEMAPTEADARAKMLIYLLENKLITLS